MMGETEASEGTGASRLVISYLTLRRAIGVIGSSLPFVLVVGKGLLGSWAIQPSISSYYYTGMRNVFVGALCATGVFLLSYRGYDRADSIASNLAGVFVVGVALLPTAPAVGATPAQTLVSHVHLTLASAYFLTLAYFSLVLFRKTNPAKQMTARKKQRNVVYTICGYTILVCIALIAVCFSFFAHSALQSAQPVFWLESAAVLAFGISWLTKGEAILADVVAPHSFGNGPPLGQADASSDEPLE
jgi:hypothetical protein